jgi:leucyl-tRNA synthetase
LLKEVKAARAIKTETEAKRREVGINTGVLPSIRSTASLLPIWVANYVLMDYGAGAVMSVPATTSAISNLRRSTRCRFDRSSRR